MNVTFTVYVPPHFGERRMDGVMMAIKDAMQDWDLVYKSCGGEMYIYGDTSPNFCNHDRERAEMNIRSILDDLGCDMGIIEYSAGFDIREWK